MLSVVPGARDVESVEAVVADVKQRTEGRVPDLMTSDNYPAYETAHPERLRPGGRDPTLRPTEPNDDARESPAAGTEVRDGREEAGEGPRGRGLPHPGGLRHDGGGRGGGARSKVSQWINTSFLERQNATDRHHNARKVRKTYTFSKDWRVHEAMTYFTMYSYNFCWPIRTLDERDEQERIRKRTPAMAAGLADHVWTMREWVI